MQTCNKCKRNLPDENFTLRKDSMKLRKVCKECTTLNMRKWRTDNPDKNASAIKRGRDRYNDIETYCHRASAKKRNDERYETSLTYEELLIIANVTDTCPICGTKLNYSKGKGHGMDNSPSLDRLNNETTVTKDNVWIICNKCNRTKSNRSLKEFAEYCAMVASKYLS